MNLQISLMQAVVLAAGRGTRLYPLTLTRPKVMLPIANKPILEHNLNELRRSGIDEVILVVGYKDDIIRNYFGDGSKLKIKIKYCTQRLLLGTAHALKSALYLINDDQFLVINGDNIIGCDDIRRITNSNKMAIGVKKISNPKNFGVVDISNDCTIKKIIEKPEKPTSNLINAGIYKFEKDIIPFLDKVTLSKRGEFELTDAIQLAIDNNFKFKAVEIENWIDVSYPWNLLDANEVILKRLNKTVINGTIEKNVQIHGNVVIENGTIVRSGSYIVGPVIIGKNCEIGPNCYIRPYTSIGNNCHIGSFVEIKNSIIMANTNIPHLSYVGDSIIGEHCNLGAGTKVANLRFDNKSVKVTIKDRKVSTEKRKFGAAIGDHVKTGINVSINVGTLIGCNTIIAPSTLVGGYIKPNSKIF